MSRFFMKSIELPLKDYIENYRDKPRFHALCEKCPNFSRTWTCPGEDTNFDYILEPYEFITIFASQFTTEVDFKLLRQELDAKMIELEHKYEGSLVFYAGSCVLCESCVKPEPCAKPELMRHSLEALGFDLGRTSSELLGIEIKWGEFGAKPEYYTLISALCTRVKLDL